MIPKRFTLIIAFVMLIVPAVMSQPGGGGNPGGGPPVPISGIELLVALGGMLGLWKLRASGSSKKR